MPRLTASSASSRGVQALTGRSADAGVSQGSHHDLHELREREGRRRSGALLISQENFDRLTQQFWLSRCGLWPATVTPLHANDHESRALFRSPPVGAGRSWCCWFPRLLPE